MVANAKKQNLKKKGEMCVWRWLCEKVNLMHLIKEKQRKRKETQSRKRLIAKADSRMHGNLMKNCN